ncbi:MAG: hypothetical protein QF886_01745 [Planctomycetota bacterium]|nr:hypothetical protein [Planctomycetota bacterium]
MAFGFEVKTEDGLALKLTREGTIERIVFGEKWQRLNSFHGGLQIRDAHNPDVPYEINASYKKKGVSHVFNLIIEELFLTAQMSYAGGKNFITIDIELTDTSKQARALDVFYIVPIGQKEWSWSPNLRTTQIIENGDVYSVAATGSGIGDSGGLSLYPFCALAGPDGGISLAVPPSHPVCGSFRYERGQLSADSHVAIAEASESRRVSLRLLLFRYNPAGGLRAAAHRYSELSPQYFESRYSQSGAALLDLTPAAIDAGGIGFSPSTLHSLYASKISQAENVTPEAAKKSSPFARVSTLFQLKYFYIYPKSPGYAESLLKYVADPVLQAEVESYWGANSVLPKIITNSMVRMPNAWPALEGFQSEMKNKDELDARQMNYLVNVDPGLFADKKDSDGLTAGKRILTSVAESLKASQLGGVCLTDVISASSALNFNPEHFPYASHPLTYDRKNQRPAMLNLFSVVSLMKKLRHDFSQEGALKGKNVWIHGKDFNRIPSYPLLHLSDVISLEAHPDQWTFDRYDPLRVNAGSKPLLAIIGPETAAVAEKKSEVLPGLLRWHTFYGIPLSLGPLWTSKTYASKLKEKSALIERHLTVSVALARAGWQTMPAAISSHKDVHVEGFGTGGNGGYFTLYSSAQQAVDVTLSMQAKTLKRATKVTELLIGRDVSVSVRKGNFLMKTRIRPADCLVLKVGE